MSESHCIEDLKVGMTASIGRTVTEADIVLFAGISGDTNPVHLDAEYADATQFKGRIAHGMLTASLLSAVLGTKLPGPGAIFMGLNIRFRAPVRPGETVTATVTVKEVIVEKRRVVLDAVCTVLGKPVIEGDATLMVASRDPEKNQAKPATDGPRKS